MANMQLGLGITYRKYGRHVESLAALNESQEIFEQRQQLIGLIGTLRAEARTFMDMNDHEQAIAVAARALSLSEKDELVQQSAYCHEVLIEAYGGDQIDLARSQFEQATKLYQSLGQELDRADAALEIAKIERDSGDEVVSKNLLEQALAVYERFNRPVKIAKTLRELGIYYQKIGDQAQAREKLQQALSLFQSMEMEVESEKTLPELDR